MEIYKTFKEAVNSIDFRILYWEFQDSDNVFDRNALLILADQLEPIFNPEGLNYYMALPDGEIRVLLMREKQIMSLFVPCQMPEKKPEPTPAEAPEPEPTPAEGAEPEAGPTANPDIRFCKECGASLKPGAKFCTKCGTRIVR